MDAEWAVRVAPVEGATGRLARRQPRGPVKGPRGRLSCGCPGMCYNVFVKLYRLITLDGIESKTEIEPHYWHAFQPLPILEVDVPYGAVWWLLDTGMPRDQAYRLVWLWEMMLSRHLDFEWQKVPARVIALADVWYHEWRRGAKYIQYTGVGIYGATPAFFRYREPALNQDYQEYAPRTCYIMTYQERMGMAELLSVDLDGTAVYEFCYEISPPPVALGRQLKEYYETWDRIYWLYCRFRKLGSGPDWLVYNWWKWDTTFVGMLVYIGDNLFKLRLPVKDPFVGEVVERREGGLYGEPDYDGIYRFWWP